MNFTDIINSFREGKASAKSHIKNLIEIAACDGNFEAEEESLLQAIADRNGLSKKHLIKIRTEPDSVKFEVPADQEEKFDQLYDLIHMMTIDKNVHNEELKLCHLFGIRFGYKKEIMPEMIESIRQNIQNGNGHQETYKRLTAAFKL